MTNKPKISVVICCYNYEKFVAEAIQSVLDQTYDNFELIIADDCSTDNSAEVIKKFNDPRITFVQNEKNLGFMGTRNKLLKMVNCDYVAFQDADDVWLPEKLEKQMQHMLKNPECSASFTEAEIIDESGKVYTDPKKCDAPLDLYNKHITTKDEILRKFYFIGNFLSHSSCLIKTKTVWELGDFNPRFIQLQDFDYWCRLAVSYDVYVVDEILMQVRRVNNGHIGLSKTTIQNNIRLINEITEIIYYYISAMNKNDFTRAFDKHLVHEIKDNDDLICEKYFLLLKWKIHGVNNKLPALLYINQNMTKQIQNKLDKKYNYSIKDYYQENSNIINLYPISWTKDYQELQNKYNEQENLKNNLEQIVNQKNSELNNLYESKSWKITKPLRFITKLFHKLH